MYILHCWCGIYATVSNI